MPPQLGPDDYPDFRTGFRLIAAMSEMAGIVWPIFYIAGPSAMVRGLRQMLVLSGVDEDDVRSEEFAGY